MSPMTVRLSSASSSAYFLAGAKFDLGTNPPSAVSKSEELPELCIKPSADRFPLASYLAYPARALKNSSIEHITAPCVTISRVSFIKTTVVSAKPPPLFTCSLYAAFVL